MVRDPSNGQLIKSSIQSPQNLQVKVHQDKDMLISNSMLLLDDPNAVMSDSQPGSAVISPKDQVNSSH